MAKLNAVFRSFVKRLLVPACVVVGIATLPAAGALSFLLTPRGNEWLRGHLESYLSQKLHTRVSIDRIQFRNLYHITFSDFSLLDRAGSVLISFKTLSVGIQWGYWWKSETTFLNDLRLAQLKGHIHRPAAATDFNYQFVLDSFGSAGKNTGADNPDIRWLVPELITLQDITLRYYDAQTRDSATIAFAQLNGSIHFEAENHLTINELRLLRSRFQYTKPRKHWNINTNVGQVYVGNGDFDFNHGRFHTNRVVLNEHFTAIRRARAESKKDETGSNAALTIGIDTLLVNKNRFSIDIAGIPKTSAREFDPFHNDFQNIGIAATALRYGRDQISGKLSQLSFVDARKFRLQAMAADFTMNDKALRLAELNLRTSRNAIRGNVAWNYPSWKKAFDDPEKTHFNITARAARLNLGEISYFLPVLLRYHTIYPLYKQNILANVAVSGSPKNIRLDRFAITTDHNRAQGTGEIRIPDRGDTWVMLDIQNGLSGKKGLLDVVSPAVLSDVLLERLPQNIRLNGKMRITAQSLQGAVALQSALGFLRLKGLVTRFSDLDHVKYDLAFEGRKFELGHILKDSTIGPLTARGRARGTGLNNPATMKLESAGFVREMHIANRLLHSVLFEARLSQGRLIGNMASSNPDLNFDLAPTIYFNRPDSLGSIFGTVDNADLQKLGFSKDSLTVGGWVSANLAGFSADCLVGNLEIASANVRFREKNIDLGRLTLDASHPGGRQVLRLKSGMADVDLSGRFAVSQMPDFALQLVQSVLKSEPFPPVAGVASFDMRGDVHASPDMLALLPGVTQLAPFSVQSVYDRQKGVFELHTSVDSLAIEGIAVDSAFLHIQARNANTGPNTETGYELGSKRIRGTAIALPLTQLSARVREGVHLGELASSDTGPGSLFRIPFTYDAAQANPVIALRDSLHFKEETWKVNPDNAIYPLARNLAGTRIALTSGPRSASFTASDEDTQGLPYQLRLANIRLAPIFALVKADSTLITGSASGSAAISQLQPLTFTAHANVDDLQVKGASFGALNAEVKSDSGDRYAVAMDIGNDRPVLSAKGIYEPSKSASTIAVDVRSFPLNHLDGLLENEIDSLQGALSGNLTVRTDTSGIKVDGHVGLDTSSFAIRETGSRIQVAAGGLTFAGNKAELVPILLRDGANGQATLTGSVALTDDRNLRYRLKLNARKFKTIGELRRREQLVYGSGKTDADLELSGNLGQLRLTGQVALNDSSQIYYRSAAVSRPDFGEGLLEFAVADEPEQVAPVAGSSPFARLINTNISVPSNATLTLLLDEYRGEKVVVRGKSNLNYSQHEGGEMQLNGKYEVTSGTYTFSVGNNIRKEFTLENGGTIQWMGDIYQPVCDLTAVYKVNTSAGALMQGTDADAEASRRKFDFLVKLKLKGNLSKPEITFELGMNETDQDAFDGTIYSKIKQINNSQSDVTKQVMSLLVLNSFMGDSPFGSLSQFSSNSLEAGAYNTIGNLLTRQLNNMLAGMVKAVDITLGVNWSESADGGRASTRSDIKLGLGKSLFNHRLNLYVGNNFGVETASGNNSGISGLANDVSVEYLLSPDGKYRIKGYHVRDNELTLHGEHMETGVKFAITWEFDQPEARGGQKKHRR